MTAADPKPLQHTFAELPSARPGHRAFEVHDPHRVGRFRAEAHAVPLSW